MVFDWLRRKIDKYSAAGVKHEVNKTLHSIAGRRNAYNSRLTGAREEFVRKIAQMDMTNLNEERVKILYRIDYLLRCLEEDELEYLERIKEIAED